LPVIAEIYNSTIPTRLVTADPGPISVESRHAWLSEHDPESRLLWVAEVDGEIAGWFSFEPCRKKPAYRATSKISVYISERRRRKGVGRRLLEEAIRRAPELGFKTLTGGIFAHNEPSLRLFEGFGFERWALYPRVAELDGVEAGRHGVSPSLQAF
jgi:L-amino acid N-acyltransferase YncA